MITSTPYNLEVHHIIWRPISYWFHSQSLSSSLCYTIDSVNNVDSETYGSGAAAVSQSWKMQVSSIRGLPLNIGYRFGPLVFSKAFMNAIFRWCVSRNSLIVCCCIAQEHSMSSFLNVWFRLGQKVVCCIIAIICILRELLGESVSYNILRSFVFNSFDNNKRYSASSFCSK